MKTLIFIIGFAQLFAASVAFAQKNWVPDVPKATQLFENKFGKLSPNDRIEATAYRDYYAVRNDDLGDTPAYFDSNFTYVANLNMKRGWRAATAEGVTKEALDKRLAVLAKDIPTEKFLRIERGSAPVFVMFSAPDCPYCKRLELALEREKISYYVAPSGMSPQARVSAEAAYCSPSPAKTWSGLFRGIRPSSSRKDCVYPLDEITDFSYFFMHKDNPVWPQIIFANGENIPSNPDELILEAKKRLAAGIVFK
jgi:hypothetical protein